jgi:hypothetical protein
MAYVQDAIMVERQARSRKVGAGSAGIDTIVACSVFFSSIGFATAIVLKLIP